MEGHGVNVYGPTPEQLAAKAGNLVHAFAAMTPEQKLAIRSHLEIAGETIVSAEDQEQASERMEKMGKEIARLSSELRVAKESLAIAEASRDAFIDALLAGDPGDGPDLGLADFLDWVANRIATFIGAGANVPLWIISLSNRANRIREITE